MNISVDILIIGFGSIGKRHYRNLLKLGYQNVKIYDTSDSAFEDFPGVSRLKKISVEVVKKFQIVFICSPNNLHIKHALICAEAGCDIFIEKPLSHNLAGIDKLLNVTTKKKNVTMVGCNMRFHPCLNFIKKYLEEKKLGDFFSIRHEFGYYLPFWRPNQDYKKNYAVKKSTGGGIILDDIHEFDLLFWFNNFQKIKEGKIMYAKISDLEIETEDNCIAIFKFRNNVLGSVACDYLQQSYSRTCKVVGQKGNLEWNFSENIVRLKSYKSTKKIFQVRKYDTNQMYLDELKYFFDCVDKRIDTFNNIYTASNVLKTVIHLKT